MAPMNALVGVVSHGRAPYGCQRHAICAASAIAMGAGSCRPARMFPSALLIVHGGKPQDEPVHICSMPQMFKLWSVIQIHMFVGESK